MHGHAGDVVGRGQAGVVRSDDRDVDASRLLSEDEISKEAARRIAVDPRIRRRDVDDVQRVARRGLRGNVADVSNSTNVRTPTAVAPWVR